MIRTVVLAVTLLCLGSAACGPIDVPAGHIDREAAGPVVTLSARRPRAAFRFTVSANDQALPEGASPGFQIWSDRLALGARDGPLLPVDVHVRSADRSSVTKVTLRRGVCRGRSCLGTFVVVFARRTDANTTLRFSWSVIGFVNYPGPSVPSGAAVEVHLGS
ncbi:MAG: hypothetical protein ACXVQJ_09755 [Actinomycetota bacterium]